MLRQRGQRAGSQDAGVGHEQVEPAELLDGPGDGPAVGGVGHVPGQRRHGRAVRQGGDGIGEPARVAGVDDHVPAAAYELGGEGGTEAP